MDETINLRLIGKRMKEAREKRHLTQAEVAEALSIHTNSYGNYERGTERPSLIKIVQSCIVLGIQPGDLLNECVPGLQLQSLANIELERPELLELITLLNQCTNTQVHQFLIALRAIQQDQDH